MLAAAVLGGCGDDDAPAIDAAIAMDAGVDAQVDAGTDAAVEVDPCATLERPTDLAWPPAEGRLPCDLRPPTLR
ncbi:hypothetical protein [Sandaracinus amylolyticus]|uniref:hypothetical protein n=1 Tax=Sandaracinus amylolyticus TaxID=927083 RepID=UPI001F47324C|nr:hypothetical protein [Sandaracinus amylolyticus]